jgi:hypothetical protein
LEKINPQIEIYILNDMIGKRDAVETVEDFTYARPFRVNVRARAAPMMKARLDDPPC